MLRHQSPVQGHQQRLRQSPAPPNETRVEPENTTAGRRPKFQAVQEVGTAGSSAGAAVQAPAVTFAESDFAPVQPPPFPEARLRVVGRSAMSAQELRAQLPRVAGAFGQGPDAARAHEEERSQLIVYEQATLSMKIWEPVFADWCT